MPLTNPFSLIKGLTFDKIREIAGPVVDNLINTMSPKSSFGDAFTSALQGNINSKDNWGLFGTVLGSAAKAVFTEPKNQTNSALPPTTGTITKYAPAVIQASKPAISIPTGRRIINRRPVVRRRVIKKPVGRKKTVNEMVAPKKKKKNYSYKINI